MALPIPPKEDLVSRYSQFGCTISKLADTYGTSNATVRGWMKKYGIERKTQQQASFEANNLRRKNIPSKKSLIENYVERSLGTAELTKVYGVGLQTIYLWLDQYNIPRRDLSESTKIAKEKQFKSIQYDKELLLDCLERYDHNKLLVSEELNVSLSHVKSLIKRHGIESNYVTYKSKKELEILEFCKNQRPDLTWVSGDRSQINPFELDIFCPELNLAIEYCGLYWHSEYYGEKDKLYHYNKWKLCNDKGIELITIFEYDNLDKVKNLIRKKCGKVDKIYARKTKCEEIDKESAKRFHNNYHLHGSIGSIKNYGLYYDDDLVLVASFSKFRFGKKYQWECTRCTTHPDIAVIGGVSKLFKRFIRDEDPLSIVTFSDLRFGKGETYLHCGFTRRDIGLPNYWYFNKRDPIRIYSRVNFQKHKLPNLLENYNEAMTEYQNMISNGWDRIWDCGNMVYEYDINSRK